VNSSSSPGRSLARTSDSQRLEAEALTEGVWWGTQPEGSRYDQHAFEFTLGDGTPAIHRLHFHRAAFEVDAALESDHPGGERDRRRLEADVADGDLGDLLARRKEMVAG
jgi:hypothetical protein